MHAFEAVVNAVLALKYTKGPPGTLVSFIEQHMIGETSCRQAAEGVCLARSAIDYAERLHYHWATHPRNQLCRLAHPDLFATSNTLTKPTQHV